MLQVRRERDVSCVNAGRVCRMSCDVALRSIAQTRAEAVGCVDSVQLRAMDAVGFNEVLYMPGMTQVDGDDADAGLRHGAVLIRSYPRCPEHCFLLTGRLPAGRQGSAGCGRVSAHGGDHG